jgi:hypothetical protein
MKEKIQAQIDILQQVYDEIESEHKIVKEYAHMWTDPGFRYAENKVVYETLGNYVYAMMRLKTKMIQLGRDLASQNEEK